MDYQLPDGDGLTLLRELRKCCPDTVVVMLTAHKSLPTAVEAMRAGAYHYGSFQNGVAQVFRPARVPR
ncbi:MAG: hypothetical protein A3H97_09435 [Acidobacteria bacterium RIFCSPLOWO2_02_FULL_65_29]|nr:MAG: hypothetical protein A3H97_09435 [Acidobacteria bacterium RIFCSPLOWO2_02_FULL_65_29]